MSKQREPNEIEDEGEEIERTLPPWAREPVRSSSAGCVRWRQGATAWGWSSLQPVDGPVLVMSERIALAARAVGGGGLVVLWGGRRRRGSGGGGGVDGGKLWLWCGPAVRV